MHGDSFRDLSVDSHKLSNIAMKDLTL